nr:MAG TPA: Major head protein [Caudoviricetes sp.]
MANEVLTTAETNLVTAAKMKRVREVDFVQQFTHNSLDKLIEVLGVTRKIPMMEGTTMYMYSTSGTLQSGAVAEGAVIPLSQYEQTKTAVGEITLNKWRKAVSAEAIKKSGLETALVETDTALLRDVQKGIRTSFFTFLNGTITGSTTATGVGLQAALANAWGKLQVKFEDDTASAVYFVNPEDIADYLGGVNISIQTVFGMNYIENFLGLGTVIMSSQVTKGTFVATAKENIVMYYLTMAGDVATAFDLVTDETGYVGIKSGYQNEERAQIESLVMDGIQFLVEYAAGVVKGTITAPTTGGGASESGTGA